MELIHEENNKTIDVFYIHCIYCVSFLQDRLVISRKHVFKESLIISLWRLQDSSIFILACDSRASTLTASEAALLARQLTANHETGGRDSNNIVGNGNSSHSSKI